MKSKLISLFTKSPTINDNQSPPPAPATRDKVPLITEELLGRSERLSELSSPHVYKIDGRYVVKTAQGIRLAEAAAMRLVAEHTSVPVPRVLDAYMRSDAPEKCCIVMEYVEGKTLDAMWPTYSDVQKQEIVGELKRYMDELRSLSAPFIGTVDRGYCEDQIFNNDQDVVYGPFDNEADFVENGLVAAIKAKEQNAWFNMVIGFMQTMPQDHRTVFTHGDFMPRNILVRDGKVAAILDWEMAGYYPEYWEYVKTMSWSDFDSFWIKDEILPAILKPYTLELALMLHARDIV